MSTNRFHKLVSIKGNFLKLDYNISTVTCKWKCISRYG